MGGGENTETFSSLTSYPELRRSEFLVGGYIGARASLLSTTQPFVAMTQELVTRGDTLQLSAPRHSVTPSVIDEQRPMWSSAPFPEMSASSGGDFFKSHKLFRTTSKSLAFVGRPTRSVILTLRSCDMRRQNLVIPHPFAIQTQSCPMARRDKIWSFCTLLSSRGGGPDDMRRQNLVIPHPFAIQTQSCPMACRDKIWSFCTLLSSRGGEPDDTRRQNLVIPHPFAIQTQSCPMARRDKIWSFCTLLSSRGGGPDDRRRQNLVIPHPFAIQTQSCPMARRDKIWSFCTLLSSRGGGPDDTRRQNLVIPHPFAIQTQSCPMARRDKIWSFCTLLSSRGGGPDDMRRQNLVISHPLCHSDTVVSDGTQRQNLVILHPLSSRGGGPDDMRRQNLVIPHPFAIQTQSCPMARRDKIWSFCTLRQSRPTSPLTRGDLHHLPHSQDLHADGRKYPSGYPYKHSFAICPLGPSRRFLQKVVASGGSNLACLGELGGNHLPYFAINRGGSEKEKAKALPKRFRNVFREEFRKGFDRSSTFFIRSPSFFDLQRITSFPVFPTFSSNKRWWRLRAYSFRGTRIPRVTRRPPAEGQVATVRITIRYPRMSSDLPSLDDQRCG
ncbi:hypothetical protein HKD37_U058737 [Glycine soja]